MERTEPPGDPFGGGPPSLSTDQIGFRDAMSRLASGVALLTTVDVVGRDCGLTVTALAAVSLHPPLVLVCVRVGGFVHDALTTSEAWAFSLLAEDQIDLARYAARHRHPGDRDDFTSWATVRGLVTGTLMLRDGVAAVECLPHSFTDAGDHVIAVGLVVATLPGTARPDGTAREPLLYVDRNYHAVVPRGLSRQPGGRG